MPCGLFANLSSHLSTTRLEGRARYLRHPPIVIQRSTTGGPTPRIYSTMVIESQARTLMVPWCGRPSTPLWYVDIQLNLEFLRCIRRVGSWAALKSRCFYPLRYSLSISKHSNLEAGTCTAQSGENVDHGWELPTREHICAAVRGHHGDHVQTSACWCHGRQAGRHLTLHCHCQVSLAPQHGFDFEFVEAMSLSRGRELGSLPKLILSAIGLGYPIYVEREE